MKHLGEIKINNRASAMIIEIEGLIGIPEGWQFENEDQRIATYERFRNALERINSTDTRHVTVHIRSIGGNVSDALLIYDALCSLAQQGIEITTICHGYVASAATIIAQAGSEARRLISSDTLYLIHNATTTLDGNSTDAARTFELLEKTDERIASIYALRSSRTAEEFRLIMARDSGRGEWLSPEEVIELGLADAVQQNSPISQLKDRIRNFFDHSANGVTNAVLSLIDEPCAENENKQIRKESTKQIDDLKQQVVNLESQLSQLSSDNAMLRALPSTTIPKEDPAIDTLDHYPNLESNKNAYLKDLELFNP